jgi:cbb3-type cytochrome c oxidase subunit III
VALAVALLVPVACGGDKPSAAGESVAQQGVATLGPRADSLRNPQAGQQNSASEGGKLFVSMNCDGCHGGGATGFAAPSLSDGRWRYGGSDGAIYQSIRDGRPKGMPAFGELLSPEIIWKLVTYLQSLPVPKSVPTQSW